MSTAIPETERSIFENGHSTDVHDQHEPLIHVPGSEIVVQTGRVGTAVGVVVAKLLVKSTASLLRQGVQIVVLEWQEEVLFLRSKTSSNRIACEIGMQKDLVEQIVHATVDADADFAECPPLKAKYIKVLEQLYERESTHIASKFERV